MVPLDTLVQVRRALSEAFRPRVTVQPKAQNPLWPVRSVPKLRGATSGAKAAPAPMGAATKPKQKRDDSRTIGFDLDQKRGVRIDLPPMPRKTPEQQQAVADAADALLKEATPIAQKVAPGIPVHVALRGRVVASTDPARVVPVTPGGKVVLPTGAPAPVKGRRTPPAEPATTG